MTFSTLVGNPYKTCEERDVICVTTNGEVKKDGLAVMGQGTAKFARDTFQDIDVKLGKLLVEHGNRVFNLGTQIFQGKPIRVVAFPTKHKWRENSDLALIKKSVRELVQLCDKFNLTKIYLPVPGGQNGKLKWSDVKPALTDLDERFVVYSMDEKTFTK
jgi:hypothetical protein